MAMLIFGTLVWFAEKGEWLPANHPALLKLNIHDRDAYLRNVGLHDEFPVWRESPFMSIIHAFWWVAVTVTTVGYGDMPITTRPGKVIASIAICCGVVILAMPIGIIGTNFRDEFDQFLKERRMRREARNRMQRRDKFLEHSSVGSSDFQESILDGEVDIAEANAGLLEHLEEDLRPVQGADPLTQPIPPHLAQTILTSATSLRSLPPEASVAQRVASVNKTLLEVARVGQALPRDLPSAATTCWIQRALLRAALATLADPAEPD